MKKIRLAIVEGPHRPSLEAGHHITATRLVTAISLASPDGWSPFHVAFVDTGAPLSLFPKSIWYTIDRRVHARVKVRGLVDKAPCHVQADLASVRCALSDGGETLGPYDITALLAHSDRVPALLGIAGCFERTDLSVSLRSRTAFLIEP